MSSQLIHILSQQHFISPEIADNLFTRVDQSPISIYELIFDESNLDSDAIARFLSQYFSLPLVDINHYNFSDVCYQLGLGALIQKHTALPVKCSANTLTLATCDPTNSEMEQEFCFATTGQVELVIADYNAIKKAIHTLYGRNLNSSHANTKEINADELEQLVNLSDDELNHSRDLSQDEAPVSRYIHQVLLEAIRKGASDIHFEPYEHQYRIRLRCDGMLFETHWPAVQLGRRLSARVKILSNLNIAERRLPQDGRTKLKLNHQIAVDMRVSTLPTLWGEKVVLRLLDSSASQLNIDALGYNHNQRALYLKALNKPQGLILITGPTGSGKTVSLYSGLSILNTGQVNIATAEDPVEINLPGINQVQIQPQIGFDFATALRSFLRQDPDIVMVGEIRDLETAEIALKASQTGHLVLSTLHTNSAAETLVRLQNMGIPTYNIASSLSLVIAQRLVRRLCNHCKLETQLDMAVSKQLNLEPQQPIFTANQSGCKHCNNGYLGRIGLFEVMEIDRKLEKAILDNLSASDIEQLAVKQGMMTLLMSGADCLRQGSTSLEELHRVLCFT